VPNIQRKSTNKEKKRKHHASGKRKDEPKALLEEYILNKAENAEKKSTAQVGRIGRGQLSETGGIVPAGKTSLRFKEGGKEKQGVIGKEKGEGSPSQSPSGKRGGLRGTGVDLDGSSCGLKRREGAHRKRSPQGELSIGQSTVKMM